MKAKSYLYFLILFLIQNIGHARAPAVEPIRGISIDQYEITDPARDPGFNWNQSDYVQETSLITTQAQMESVNSSNSKNWPTYLFVLSLLSLPFLLWYSIVKSLDASEEQTLLDPNNTFDLSEERKKREESSNQDNDKDLPKAS